MNTNDPHATIPDTHSRTLYSKIVNDEYELSIYLPPSYESSDQTYSTLYVLDSPLVFGSAVTAAMTQNWDSVADVPEMIIVGIGKRFDSLDPWWPIRERDYVPTLIPTIPHAGHAASFLDFMDKELIPFIDTEYRTQPNDRVIWGNSLGGIFVLYAMFNRTNLFTRYISVCPAFYYGEKTIFDYELALSADSLATETRLFVAVGAQDHQYGPNVEAFMDALSTRKMPNLTFQTLVLDGLGHAPACVPALYYGIEAVYAM